MMHADHIEDHPSNPDMVIAYVGYGTPNQVAYLMERAMLLVVQDQHAFLDAELP